jgi:hypothetical protein
LLCPQVLWLGHGDREWLGSSLKCLAIDPGPAETSAWLQHLCAWGFLTMGQVNSKGRNCQVEGREGGGRERERGDLTLKVTFLLLPQSVHQESLSPTILENTVGPGCPLASTTHKPPMCKVCSSFFWDPLPQHSHSMLAAWTQGSPSAAGEDGMAFKCGFLNMAPSRSNPGRFPSMLATRSQAWNLPPPQYHGGQAEKAPVAPQGSGVNTPGAQGMTGS